MCGTQDGWPSSAFIRCSPSHQALVASRFRLAYHKRFLQNIIHWSTLKHFEIVCISLSPMFLANRSDFNAFPSCSWSIGCLCLKHYPATYRPATTLQRLPANKWIVFLETVRLISLQDGLNSRGLQYLVCWLWLMVGFCYTRRSSPTSPNHLATRWNLCGPKQLPG